MERLLALPKPPDAVFCLSDLLAIGAMRTIHRSGRRIPDDIAVLGFDDVDDAAYLTPTLSSMRPDKAQIAELAVDVLDRRFAAPEPAQVWRANCDLVPRESTLGVS
ncbi:substrate-binding domain-containing protein [Fodinicola feengrottensis]|nr:substrate-binding domain-containing protein [Fodinicola feengrottensis]